jgi:U3 small nucleolar RNA-associated protein 20
MPNLLGAVAVALQASPMSEVLPYMRPLMEAVINEQFSQFLLPFCSLFSNYGSERFHSVVMPYFQRYVNFLIAFWLKLLMVENLDSSFPNGKTMKMASV